MKINEVIEKVDLTKRAIKFYEEKGFLKVKRNDNGYREYSEEDVLLLKEISSYRKLGISLSDIKIILNDKTKLKDILLQKKQELTNYREEISALEKFIKDNDINRLYSALDYRLIADAIKESVPGFYGFYFLNHFLPYLQISIDTEEQQEAYNRIIEFWDNTEINIPLSFKISSWLAFKLYNEDTLKANVERIDNQIKKYLNPSEEEYEELKKQVLNGYKIKSSFLYKYSISGLAQRKMMRELQNKGYNDIFIPNMIKLSPKYKEYHEAFMSINNRICDECGLYYDSKFQLVKKK